MTDEEYARALEGLAGGRRISAVIVDPSAASFIEVLRRKGWRVRKAENDVLSGIRLTSDLLKAGKIVICEGCADCLREMERVRLGFIRRGEGQGAQGARPRHGRHAVLRRHGSGGAAGGSFRVGGGEKALTGDVRVIFA